MKQEIKVGALEALSALEEIESCASRLDSPPDHLLISAYLEYAAFEAQERKRLEKKLRALTHDIEVAIERWLAGYQDTAPQAAYSPYLSRVNNERDAK